VLAAHHAMAWLPLVDAGADGDYCAGEFPWPRDLRMLSTPLTLKDFFMSAAEIPQSGRL